jgi:hypothetical protein
MNRREFISLLGGAGAQTKSLSEVQRTRITATENTHIAGRENYGHLHLACELH